MADNINARMIARIDAIYDQLSDEPGIEDRRVLTYIREQLHPDAIAARHEEDRDVSHLHQVAAQRLRSYERKATTEEAA